MVLPSRPGTGYRPRAGAPRRLVNDATKEYELYEDEGEFVLSVELPGFDREEIGVNWDDGNLQINAIHEDDRPERERVYRRTFQLPTEIVEEDIVARYRSGILDVYLPLETAETSGTEIPVEG